jgi:hypothetical protein
LQNAACCTFAKEKSNRGKPCRVTVDKNEYDNPQTSMMHGQDTSPHRTLRLAINAEDGHHREHLFGRPRRKKGKAAIAHVSMTTIRPSSLPADSLTPWNPRIKSTKKNAKLVKPDVVI